MQRCDIDPLTFQGRLKKATQFYVNILSDRDPNEREDFNGFGELMFKEVTNDIQFYCVMSAPSSGGSVKFVYSASCDSADDLENWLHSVDALAAKSYPELRFKGFSGAYSKPDNKYTIEADFYKPNY